jgi:hypothetical protein
MLYYQDNAVGLSKWTIVTTFAPIANTSNGTGYSHRQLGRVSHLKESGEISDTCHVSGV